MVMAVISLVHPFGDRRMAYIRESGCGNKTGGINSELDCVVMAIAVEKFFVGMVEWDIGSVGMQCSLMCHRW